MRHIVKGTPLNEFSTFVCHKNPKKWEDVPTDLKLMCIEYILNNEQDWLSGYTERPISKISVEIHLDHYKKRDLFPQPKYVFDWGNLIVDEHNPNYGADYKDNNKSNKVSKLQDYLLLLNPVDDSPEVFFDYNMDGDILPAKGLNDADRQKAEFTIKTFNLGHESLVRTRRKLYDEIESYKKGGLDDQTIESCLREQGFPSFIKWAINALNLV